MLPRPKKAINTFSQGVSVSAKRVLVVEDEALIAVYLKSLLEEFGVACLGPICKLSEAIRQAETAVFDAAVLNLVIEGQPAYAVAEILSSRGIPFGFASGVGRGFLDEAWGDRPHIEKPYTGESLRALLDQVMPGWAGPGSAYGSPELPPIPGIGAEGLSPT